MRFALRQLAKSPGFTLVAVLSLALGIGANTALFSLVDDILLRSLPVKAPHELVLVRWLSGRNGMFNSLNGSVTTDPVSGLQTSTSVSYFIFDRLRQHAGPFSDLFAFAELQQLNVSVDNSAEIASGQLVTGGYYAGLGVSMLRGRPLGPDDDRPGAPPAVVVSYRYWQRRLGGADSAIGTTIRINHVAATVVGVTPPDFNGTLQVGAFPDLTLPMSLDPDFNGGRSSLAESNYWWIQVMGRLRPGVTAAGAQAQLEPVFIQAARDGWVAAKVTSGPSPKLEDRVNPRLRLQPGHQGMTETRTNYLQPLRVLMCIVGVVLLIACVNVANLLLARSAVRAKEMAIRLAVGASRWRLIRQLLTESLLLSGLGGACGVLVAYWGRDALLRLRPIGGTDSLALDWHVLGFTLGVSVLTGVLFGLVPAWRATRVDFNSELKSTAGSIGPARFGLRRVLMIVQVGLSVVLLVGAGLFLRTLRNLRATDIGFNRENVLLFRVDAGLNNYAPAQTAILFDRLLERLASLPGVRSAAHSRHPLLSGSRRTSSITVPNTNLPPGTNLNSSVQIVSPGFLPTMGIPVLLGRNVGERDVENSARVAVVNETFARTFFPGESPVGRTFTLRNNQVTEIVGVARDARYYGLRDAIPPTIYLPFRQEISGQASFAVRLAGSPLAAATAIRSAVHEVDANLPIFELRSQDEQIDRLIAQERLFALLSVFFAVVALLLTCIGLYGLLAHQVTARTREIGIRMALGAQLRAVVGLVLTEGLCLAVIGMVFGIGAAIALSSFVSKMLFGVPPNDPVSIVGAGLLLVVIAALACLIPARRAAKVDPMTALRAE